MWPASVIPAQGGGDGMAWPVSVTPELERWRWDGPRGGLTSHSSWIGERLIPWENLSQNTSSLCTSLKRIWTCIIYMETHKIHRKRTLGDDKMRRDLNFGSHTWLFLGMQSALALRHLLQRQSLEVTTEWLTSLKCLLSGYLWGTAANPATWQNSCVTWKALALWQPSSATSPTVTVWICPSAVGKPHLWSASKYI